MKPITLFREFGGIELGEKKEDIPSTPIKLRPKPIFPDIQYERKIDRVELETYVRILRNGEYYTLCFKRTVQFPLGEIVDPNYVAEAYQKLIEHIYVAMYHHQFPDWQVADTNQEPEAERLSKIYPFFSIKHP